MPHSTSIPSLQRISDASAYLEQPLSCHTAARRLRVVFTLCSDSDQLSVARRAIVHDLYYAFRLVPAVAGRPFLSPVVRRADVNTGCLARVITTCLALDRLDRVCCYHRRLRPTTYRLPAVVVVFILLAVPVAKDARRRTRA